MWSRLSVWFGVREGVLGWALLALLVSPATVYAGAAEDWQTAYDAELAGEWDLAIHNYTRAIRSGELTQTGLARVFRSRGNVHLAGGNIAEAMKDYDTAVRLDPTYNLAYISRGVVFHEQRNYQLAIADYDQAIALDPDYLCPCLCQSRRRVGTTRTNRRRDPRFPNGLQAWFHRGMAGRRLGRIQRLAVIAVTVRDPIPN